MSSEKKWQLAVFFTVSMATERTSQRLNNKQHNSNITKYTPNKFKFVRHVLITGAVCSYCVKSTHKSFCMLYISRNQLSFILKALTVSSEIQSWKCLSVKLKKIDTALQLKNSLIQQGKVYSTGKTTTEIPGNHQSLWQASPKIVFIPSLWLFIASCKAAPSHFQCIGQSSKPFELWAERYKGVRHIIARIDRGDTLSPWCPVSGSRGTEVRVPGSLGGSILTDIIHKQPTQMVFIQMQGQSQACWQSSHPCTGVDKGDTHTHTKSSLTENISVLFGVRWSKEVHSAVDCIGIKRKCDNNKRLQQITLSL